MYHLKGIWYNSITASGGSGFVGVFDRSFEDGAFASGVDADPLLWLNINAATAQGYLPLDEKSKYVSVIPDRSAAGNHVIIIFYKLIPASKADLIWEWLSKRS